ncbi:MAG: LTA synthase family protein, partial [Muribaculaceae bacterium]|nr:LTA synthase family protein [Muribaculaceae bacterium]
MKTKILRLLIIYASFVILFMIAKPVFILCNTEVYSHFSVNELSQTVLHGLRMDMSMAGYLTVIPAFMIIAGIWTPRRWPELTIAIWRYIAVALIVLTVMTDAILYGYWHFKLDTTPVFYFLSSPQAAMASTAAWVPFAALLAAAVLTAATGRGLGYLWNITGTGHMVHGKVRATAACGIMTAALFIPIRGGITVSTMNPSAAYFSTTQELNHAAVNPMFSLLYSATHQNNFSKEFRYFTEDEKNQILEPWLESGRQQPDSTVINLLGTRTPDIYFIILESFSSHLMPCLGGEPVALNLDSIARKSITMTNFYASSFRTDRAIPAILSGYPAQPST